MQTMFIMFLLFLQAITRIDGSGIPWRQENLSTSEKTMETILKTCYENDSLSVPIVIIGDYNGRVYGSSIIRLNHSFKRQRYTVRWEFKRVPASKVIIIGESPKQVLRNMIRWNVGTIWWSKQAQIFILLRNHETCKNVATVLSPHQLVPNVIYICTPSKNESLLMTVNWVGNYAPYPWKEFGAKIRSFNVFYQRFNPQSSCTNLEYDKTKTLNGISIATVALSSGRKSEMEAKAWTIRNLAKYGANLNYELKILRTIILKLNASLSVEMVGDVDTMFYRCARGDVDIAVESVQQFFHRSISCLFPYYNNEIVAIVKLNREVSTLEKIRNLWNPLVLILAAVALAILYLILAIMNHDFSFALLDLTRLLIYSAILRISKRHSFKIYFTTMLIFMVISNGVFQGKIAAFLTTHERQPAIRTINELVQLDYKIYTLPHMSRTLIRSCPKCKFEEIEAEACINYVLNSTRRACAILKDDYEQFFNMLPLDQVEEPFWIPTGSTFCHYREWSLADRASHIVMTLVESGLINFWKMQETYEGRQKRKERESEWSSEEYRPVKLYKLGFAFYGLALGLLISTIVFVLELLVANCRVFEKKCNYSKCLNKCRKRKVIV